MDNPALFLNGTPMPLRLSTPSFLLFTGDSGLQSHIQETVEPAHLTVVKDVRAMSRVIARRAFHGVILETRRDRPGELAEVHRLIDPKQTFLLAGSSAMLRDAPRVVSSMNRANGQAKAPPARSIDLEDFLESKIGEFVRAMREGSGRNLHATLIKAVERPLIIRVLRETNGNQIQAAELLGMNRNTLRKKIKEFKIPVKREPSTKA
ncbi:MAG: hypothetical protein HZB35_09805 [Nitrospirae bacterium]|nr:hypothetical protein [Nitrospirota bacterium]